MDNAAWKSARIGFASTAASQVTALMWPSALDAMHSAVLRASPVQGLAANVSRLAVGVGAQPALLAMSTLAERIAPAQELVTSMRRLAVGIAGEPAPWAMSTLADRISPARERELVTSVSGLGAAFAPNPAAGLVSTWAERMSSSVLNLHASPLSELVKTFSATSVLGQKLDMSGMLDKLGAVRGHFIEQRSAPLETMGLVSFVDVAPAVALASWKDRAECVVAGLRAGSAAEELTDEHLEVELQATISCSECGNPIAAEGMKLTAWGRGFRLEAFVALCPTCVENDSITLSHPALYGIDGDELGDKKPRGILRLIRRN